MRRRYGGVGTISGSILTTSGSVSGIGMASTVVGVDSLARGLVQASEIVKINVQPVVVMVIIPMRDTTRWLDRPRILLAHRLARNLLLCYSSLL